MGSHGRQYATPFLFKNVVRAKRERNPRLFSGRHARLARRRTTANERRSRFGATRPKEVEVDATSVSARHGQCGQTVVQAARRKERFNSPSSRWQQAIAPAGEFFRTLFLAKATQPCVPHALGWPILIVIGRRVLADDVPQVVLAEQEEVIETFLFGCLWMPKSGKSSSDGALCRRGFSRRAFRPTSPGGGLSNRLHLLAARTESGRPRRGNLRARR